MGVDKVKTTSFEPRTNGMEEKIHRVINSMMAKIVDDNQKNWSDLVPMVASAYRSSQNSVTGYSPNFLVLGMETKMPVDLILGTPGDPSNSLSVNDYVAQLQNNMLI